MLRQLTCATIALLLSICSMAQSKYNAKEAFNPQFYPYPGNEFRSASGEPGPRYWQNRADYIIAATLDTTAHKVSGQVDIIYTNNSPDALKFLWLQLDQNIYKKDSRGTAVTSASALAGGRYSNTGYTEGYQLKNVSLEAGGKTYKPRYTVSDTRMQVWLQESMKAAGGKAVSAGGLQPAPAKRACGLQTG